MRSQEIEDPLKSLENILDPDERCAFFVGNLEDVHTALNNINLHTNVPLDVKQLFETAKNLSLYSWFVYRFHQVAEMVGFSAMEMALRKRFELENPDRKAPMFRKLLKHAKKKHWISDKGFPGYEERAANQARSLKILEAIESLNPEEGQGSLMVEDPTMEEVMQTIENMDIVGAIVESAPELRNNLAHGSSTLHPNSISTLRTAADVINQVFSVQDGITCNSEE